MSSLACARHAAGSPAKLGGRSLAVMVAKLKCFRNRKVRSLLAHAGFDATRAKRLCKTCRELVNQGKEPIHPHGKYDRE